MFKVRVPPECCAAMIRAGRVTIGGVGNIATVGHLLLAAAGAASEGLRRAAASRPGGSDLRFPFVCCNCLSTKMVRPVESLSTVNRGVAYCFRLPVPHCEVCFGTASKRRPGILGTLAASLAVALVVGVGLIALGASTNRDGFISAAPVVAPVVGLAASQAWARRRPLRAGQASRYQAVYVSAIELDVRGTPQGFVLSFENDSYGRQLLNENAGQGVRSLQEQ